MRKFFALIVFCAFVNHSFAQDENSDRIGKITDSIENEGKMLHKSEWASWYGTDIFRAKCADKVAQSGGYLSYDTGTGLKNIFFTKGDDPVVIATTSFGYDFNASNYSIDTLNRKFTPFEKTMFTIRHAALKDVQKDTLFKFYKNTSLNPIPIINKGVKKVYFLTGTNLNGVVIFGNDYLMTFNLDNSIASVKRLHKNIISISSKDTSVIATMHSHLPETGDFITATDICTLMLYEKFTTWKTHYVISKNYVSIWDCKKDDLVILTMQAWKRIIDDQKQRNAADTTKK